MQIEQDIAVCVHKLPGLICRPVGAQVIDGNTFALFEFEQSREGVKIVSEKHYKLVPPEEVTEKDLEDYRSRTTS